ncbi:hypothetical protein L7F22_065469 [Adiantum nelumboides]|nr:hypothetical protein [Adiantum nelumboides]
MSLSKEHSLDKADWVKWPHLETHWQPQHLETPHRAIKRAGKSRSHSWWWDSHISPKSSKWLQENLAEMDTKVNAMLKIIEEDADSFGKRAEMYYKRRPELLNLVEEFYRTYRALVERHTFLTKELRQNIAPALQAQLGTSYATPSNLSGDLDGIPNSDGLDITSLSSYTFPGALEFDEDSSGDFLAKKANDNKDVPPGSSMVNFETREYEFKPSSSSSEEELHSPHHKERELHMPVDAASAIEFKKRIEMLEDEKKTLLVKSGEDDMKIADLKSEVSDLLMKEKALHAEDKMGKDRLNALLLLKQSLEADNLNLNHALITCKEEKTQLTEARDHESQASRLDTLMNEKDELEKQMREALESNLKLKLDLSLLEAERVEASKHVEQLLTDKEDLQIARDQALAKCKDFEMEGLALKQGEERLKAQLELKLAEEVSAQNEKLVLEADLAQVHLEIEKLQSQVSAFSSENTSLLLQLGEAMEQASTAKIMNLQLQARTEDFQAECRTIERDLQSQLTRGVELEEVMSSLLHEKQALGRNLVEAQRALQCLEEEKRQLTIEVKQGQAFADDLNGRMVNVENEKKQVSLDLEQAGQQVVRLQEVNDGLSIKYRTQDVELAKLEEQIALLKLGKEVDCKIVVNSEGKVHDLEVRVSELLAEITVLNEQASQMTEGIRSLEAELADVHQQKEAISEKLVTSANSVLLLQKQLDTGITQKIELRQHVERIQALEMEIQSMQIIAGKREKEVIREHQRSLDNTACLQTRIQELEEQVNHGMEDRMSLVKGFEEQIEKLQLQLQSSNDMTQHLEAELFKLQKAVSSAELCKSIPVHVHSRDLGLEIIAPGRFDHLHCTIGSLLEEQKQLAKEVGSQKGEKEMLASRVKALEKDKDAVHMELMQAREEREQMVTSLSAEGTKVKHLTDALKKTQQALDESIEEKVTLRSQLNTAGHEQENLQSDLTALRDELKKNQQVTLEAARYSEELAGELSQLRQAHAVVENELKVKVFELSSAHESASKLLLSKGVLEEEAQQHLCHIKALNEEVERLQHEFQDAEQKIASLKDELTKLEIECLNGRKAACETEKEIGKQIATANSLKEKMGALCSRISELEQVVSRVGDEKKNLSDEMEALLLELKDAQRVREDLMLQVKQKEFCLKEKELEHRGLQEQLQAAERNSVKAKEEMSKIFANRDSLNLEVSMMLSNLRRIERDLTCVKEEKETLTSSLDNLQSEMTDIQAENEHLKAQLKAASLELERKDSETRNMQEQLKAAESHSSLLAEALLSMKSSLGAQVERLQEEISHFKATSIQVQKDLASQLEHVNELKGELSGLHDEKSLLQEERDLGNKELADVRREASVHLNELEVAVKREHKKDAELLKCLALTKFLKQSLAGKELENLNLIDDLRRFNELHNAAEKRYTDEISFLQSEELKWRTEASATSDLMAEKVASLRLENAALHQDLSLKIELVLRQQKEVELLTEECKDLSQALQDMSAEMNEVRSDLQIFKDVVIPSMEERASELQDEINGLTTLNERHVVDIATLRTQLEDANCELFLLHERNSIWKMKYIFNVEMLKHVDSVLKTANTQSAALCEKLGLQVKHCQMLEQMLYKATDGNEAFSEKLLSISQEKNSLEAYVHHLLAMLAEVEQLGRELACARAGIPLLKENNPAGGDLLANLGSLSNCENDDIEAGEPVQEHNDQVQEHKDKATQNPIRGSRVSVSALVPKIEQACSGLKHDNGESFERQQQRHSGVQMLQNRSDVVESDGTRELGTLGKNETVVLSLSLSPVVVERLKKEIVFLQEKIHELELVTGEQGTREFLPSAPEGLLSPCRNSTASSSSSLTVDDSQDRLNEMQRLKEENGTLIKEVESLKGQSLSAWMELNLVENTVRGLQASKTVLQEQNIHLQLEVNSCSKDIVRLQEDLTLSQQKNTALLQDVDALIEEKRKSEEALRMLEDVIGSLECNNGRLRIENELAAEELKKVQGILTHMHNEGIDLVGQMKVKMVATFEEVKLLVAECRKEMGDEDVLRFLMGNGHECSEEHVQERLSLLDFKQTRSSNEKELQESVATNMLFLTELQARAEEVNMLAEILLCIRKMMSMFFSISEHTCQRNTFLTTIDAMAMKGEGGEGVEARSPEEDVGLESFVHHRIKLAERLHQAFVDEKLEHELLELKEGRKQLKQDLQLRLNEVQRMESELEKLEGLLEEEGNEKKRVGTVTHDENKSKNKRAEENVKELRDILAQQRGQICRMKEEVMFGEAQQEAAAEDQVTVLVSMESTSNMDGWDDEQVGMLSKDLEGLRSLNRRHSAELQTISQDLQSMGSIIKSAQDQLLQESSEDGEEEISSIANLRAEKSNAIDLRAQNTRVSTDSAQQLLPPSPRIVEGDFVSGGRMSSEGSIGQFPLKPRNFGFTWFMLLFSPDRKASSLVRGKNDKAVWAALRRSRRSSSGSPALVVERGRRKVAGCLACVSNPSRLDSFEHR